jgi:hypothetical protein
VARPQATALVLSVAWVTFLGVVLVPMYNWATMVAQTLF